MIQILHRWTYFQKHAFVGELPLRRCCFAGDEPCLLAGPLRSWIFLRV